jgi:hypothetical protein
MVTRLWTAAPDLAQRLQNTDGPSLRRIAAAMVNYALARTEMSDCRLDAAVGMLDRGPFGISFERNAVAAIVEQLDKSRWDL